MEEMATRSPTGLSSLQKLNEPNKFLTGTCQSSNVSSQKSSKPPKRQTSSLKGYYPRQTFNSLSNSNTSNADIAPLMAVKTEQPCLGRVSGKNSTNPMMQECRNGPSTSPANAMEVSNVISPKKTPNKFYPAKSSVEVSTDKSPVKQVIAGNLSGKTPKRFIPEKSTKGCSPSQSLSKPSTPLQLVGQPEVKRRSPSSKQPLNINIAPLTVATSKQLHPDSAFKKVSTNWRKTPRRFIPPKISTNFSTATQSPLKPSLLMKKPSLALSKQPRNTGVTVPVKGSTNSRTSNGWPTSPVKSGHLVKVSTSISPVKQRNHSKPSTSLRLETQAKEKQALSVLKQPQSSSQSKSDRKRYGTSAKSPAKNSPKPMKQGFQNAQRNEPTVKLSTDMVENMFERLKIADDRSNFIDDSILSNLRNLQAPANRVQLNDLIATLADNMKSIDTYQNGRRMLEKLVESVMFTRDIPSVLIAMPMSDDNCIAMLGNLAIILKKIFPIFVDTKYFSSLRIPLLVCRDAAKRLNAVDILQDFETLLDMKIENCIMEVDGVEDFRCIPIYPVQEDIDSPPEDLMANIIDGPYQSMEQYLGIQFRLLREDLIGPLRDSIQDAVGFYKDVTLGRSNVTNDGVIFSLSCRGFCRDSDDKKLMDGSLICLSNDDFKNVLYMAVIARTSIPERKLGTIQVMFVENFMASPNNKFVMVECPSYFEAYKHVLVGLQSLTKNSFPFQDYIVKVNKDVKPPRYLKPETRYTLPSGYDWNVKVLKKLSWPSAEELNLDSAQMKAFQYALTNELAIIQGPPGTGKTFIGLKIVETLLLNKTIWNDGNQPILVVCFTNHALDQFLEGILKFCPKNVVRIGGQSKSTIVNDHNLSQLRKELIGNERIRELKKNRKLCYRYLDKIRQNIDQIQAVLVQSHMSVLNKQMLIPYMIDVHYEQFESFDDGTNEYPIIEFWLQVLDFNRFDSSCFSQPNWAQVSSKPNSQYPLKKEIITRELQSIDSMDEFEILTVRDVWLLRIEERWRLYRCWVQLLRENCLRNMYSECSNKNITYSDVVDLGREIDVEILSSAKVIGMTTTGAAKNLKLIGSVAPKIVVIEEAAEVLEAHALMSINSNCEHVIMIGDHKQLRPNPNHHLLAKNYKFDVSLFERLINNGLPYETLSLQHRMRPIVSAMLTPHIYRELRNHSSVEQYENISGISTNLFFVNHSHPEIAGDSGLRSFSNAHEARFLVSLCRYLIQQNYNQKLITILTTYRGQLKVLQTIITSYGLSDVACDVVDNFQGEENDIILLSMVRSNQRGSIGFLKIPNRMCVALSRSRMGFYCIGNFELLGNRGGDVWQPVVDYLKSVSCIGQSLKLVCPNHPNKITDVCTSDDFKKVPEGGCQEQCDSMLPCGHRCPLFCHGYDRGHLDVRCNEPCLRKCQNNDHDCVKRCWEDCERCRIEVKMVYPDCKHTCLLPCYRELKDVPCGYPVYKHHPDCEHLNTVSCGLVGKWDCKQPCGKTLECGHRCLDICGDKCFCNKSCGKTMECGHRCLGICGNECSCNEPCGESLECGHRCLGICGDECFCSEPCEMKLECGHTCQLSCGKPCSPFCNKACERTLICGHRCRLRCGDECDKKATNCMVRTLAESPCGHVLIVPCSKINSVIDLLHLCQYPCQAELPCGHLCNGKCGQCAQGRNHIQCVVDQNRLLMCGHRFKSPCFFGSIKTNCHEPCEYVCGHGNRCPHPCSWQCKPCRQKCTWQCLHYTCTRPCDDVCDRPPCDEDCQLLLKCGHRCVGLCGEVCPPLCIACDGRPEVFFDTEVDSNARYMLLENCGHIFEVKSLDKWMRFDVDVNGEDDNGGDRLFAAKRCPKCDVLVSRASRYNSVIKSFRNQQRAIKKIAFMNDSFVVDKMKEIIDMWATIGVNSRDYGSNNGRRQQVNDGRRQQVNSEPRADERVRSLLANVKTMVTFNSELTQVMPAINEKFTRLENWLGTKIPTAIEMANIYREFLRIWYLKTLVDSSGYRNRLKMSVECINGYHHATKYLTSCNQFTLSMEDDVRQLLSMAGTQLVKTSPKPMKQSVTWCRNWFKCAICGHVYYRLGFQNVVEEIGCTNCNKTQRNPSEN